MLRLRLKRAVPEGGLHQDLRPQLEARRWLRSRRAHLRPDLHCPGRGFDECRQRPEGAARGSGGQGEQREQGLHQTQAGDGDPERREAPQGREDPAQQEDGPFLRTGAGGHHGGHQAGLWSGEEALHAGRKAGRMLPLPISRMETLEKSPISS